MYQYSSSTCIYSIHISVDIPELVVPIRNSVIFESCTILTRRVPLVNQELFTLPQHPRIHPDFSWVRATRSLVLCTCFVDRCLFVCIFFFGHCVVCSSSIYGLLLPLWYLQTLLTRSFIWDLHGSRFSCLFNALYICVCAFVLSSMIWSFWMWPQITHTLIFLNMNTNNTYSDLSEYEHK